MTRAGGANRWLEVGARTDRRPAQIVDIADPGAPAVVAAPGGADRAVAGHRFIEGDRDP